MVNEIEEEIVRGWQKEARGRAEQEANENRLSKKRKVITSGKEAQDDSILLSNGDVPNFDPSYDTCMPCFRTRDKASPVGREAHRSRTTTTRERREVIDLGEDDPSSRASSYQTAKEMLPALPP